MIFPNSSQKAIYEPRNKPPWIYPGGNNDRGCDHRTAGRLAVTNFIKARANAQKNSCIANLRLIDSSVQQWALENKKVSTDTYLLSDSGLLGYFKGSILPYCPGGGTYSPGTVVAELPTCSFSNLGHTL